MLIIVILEENEGGMRFRGSTKWRFAECAALYNRVEARSRLACPEMYISQMRFACQNH